MGQSTSRVILFLGLLICFLFALNFISPIATEAQNDQPVNIFDYFFSDGSTNHMSNGEAFTYVETGPSQFRQCKNESCSAYEDFIIAQELDGTRTFRHADDSTWANEQGDITGPNGEKLLLFFAEGHIDPANPGDFVQPMPWVPEYMTVGQKFQTAGTVMGKNAETGEWVTNQYTGHVNFEMTLVYQGAIKFPNGAYSNDAIIMEITSGPGQDERFYYDIEKGWIGFDRGVDGTGAYITESTTDDPLLEEYLEILTELLQPPIPIVPSVAPKKDCENKNPEDGSFRPAACKDCGREILYPTYSCAETYIVEQDTFFYIHEGDGPHGWDEDASEVKYCPDDREDQQNVAFFERGWGGKTTIDIDNTVVPFVGFRDKPPSNQEAKYQTRYFTGSWISEGPSKDFLDEANRETFFYYRDLESGVMNKILSPRELDRLRCGKIADAISGADEDYQIPHEQNPYLRQDDGVAFEFFNLTEFGNDAPPCQLLRLEPPDKDAGLEERATYEQQYTEIHQEYLVWLNTAQARFWPYIPLTTLKDAPGRMILQIQRNPGALTQTSYQLSFPHIATLYQASKILYDNLTPEWGSGSAAPQLGENTTPRNQAIIAGPSDEYLEGLLEESNSFCGYKKEGENSRILLAQAPPETNDDIQYAYQVGVENIRYNPDTNTIDYGIRITGLTGPAQAGLHVWFGANGAEVNDSTGMPGYYDSTDPHHSNRLPPAQVDENGNFTITITVFNPHIHTDDGVIREISYQCQGQVDLATGEIISTSCSSIGAPISEPKNYCKNPDQFTPGTCKKDALEDTNQDLDLICSSPYPIEPGVIVSQYHATFTQNQLNKLLTDLNKCIDDCKAKYPDPDDSSERGVCYEGCRWRRYGEYNALIMYRTIGMDLYIPYLEKIGHDLIGDGDAISGLFDIFRPPLMPRFEEKPAKSELGYSYQEPFSNSEAPGEKDLLKNPASHGADPGGGDFYYPWLGGIEEAKQCVSTVLLQPDVTLDQVRASRFCPTIEKTIDENYEGGQGPYF